MEVYLELGVEFKSLIQEIREQENNNANFIVAVEKRFLDQKQWSDSVQRAGGTNNWDQFPKLIVINQTAEALPKLAVDRLMANDQGYTSQQSGNLLLASSPLTDLDGNEVGLLIVLQDVSGQLARTTQSIWFVLVISSIVGASVIIFFYFFLARVERDLASHTIKLKDEICERKRAEETSRESEEKFREMAENITDMFWMTSSDMRQVLYVSPAYETMWGHTAESLYADPSQWAEAIPAEDRERVFTLFSSLGNGVSSASTEFQISRPDGEMRWIYGRGFPVRDATGTVVRLTGIASDITDRKRIEGRLIQSQKMETVGKLAGGVAHEFNSILTAIIGQTELLLSDLSPDNPLGKNVQEIRNAADRAALLTRQLLAYGRKQILQPEILDLNQVLSNLIGTLQHLMGNEVDVRLVPAVGLKKVKIDPGQMEQVIVNIAMKAADAMPNGGKLTLETANVSLDDGFVRPFPGLKPGDYVMVAITDTGIGMSNEVKARVFEPFFSTKGVGQGTGLGLATCYGILKQSEGHINVYSEVARGATFKIYLPQVAQPAKAATAFSPCSKAPRWTTRIPCWSTNEPLPAHPRRPDHRQGGRCRCDGGKGRDFASRR